MSPEEHLAAALAGLGFQGDVEMAGTPARVAEMLGHFVPGAPPPPVTPLPTRSDDVVVIRRLPYHSLCAHHLLPFFGECTIVYKPRGAIAGLGWFPRLLGHLAAQPQLQERLCAQLADEIEAALSPEAVGVRLTARQLCVEMRGPRSTGTFETHTWRGRQDAELSRLLG
ncbi:MAG: GTP cyclohydrolase I [Myxococcota bacterium]|jgi:GTP cyclohydrolase I